MKYFNVKYKSGIETVDQLDRNDFKTYREFRDELRLLQYEYHIAGINVYISTRCTNDWRD
jgi:hypothetical protein